MHLESLARSDGSSRRVFAPLAALTSTIQSIARCYIEHLVQRLCGCGGREGEPTSGADPATRSTASASMKLAASAGSGGRALACSRCFTEYM